MTQSPTNTEDASTEGQPPAKEVSASAPETSTQTPPVDYLARLWQRLHEHKVLQWALTYLGAALALAHGQELLAATYAWPHIVGQVFMGLLIIGFPIILVFSWYHGHRGLKSFSPAEMTIVALLILLGAGGLMLFVRPSAEHGTAGHTPASHTPAKDAITHAQDGAQSGDTAKQAGTTSVAALVEEISSFVQRDRYGAAYALARPLIGQAHAKEDQNFQNLWGKINLPIKPLVSEAGATVYFKPYDDNTGEWIKAGVTPFAKAVDAPRGPLKLKIEKAGFRTGYFVVANPGPSLENDPADPDLGGGLSFAKVPLPLAAEGALPDDMVLVPHTNIPVYISGWSQSLAGDGQYDIPAFGIAKYEVTNQEFKEFVDAGGYESPTYWEGLKFEEDGRELSWEEARKRFVDATGRPGPAGWQLSTYPASQAEMPVGGISWYEAVAYARFRGQPLPTIHHWARAAFGPNEAWFNTAPAISLASQFSANGPIAAHNNVGIGPWGTFNMAGNVREWVWNSTGSQGLAMGGAWVDYATLFQTIFPAPPMQRAPENGMRLMHPLPGREISPELMKPIALTPRDFAREPVSDDAFEAMRFQFTARAKPKDIVTTQVQETPLWTAEEVIVKFADRETTTLYIVKPKSRRVALQPIIYGPPGDCCIAKRPNRNALEQVRPPGDTIINSGRALVIPVWFGSYERALPPRRDQNEMADLSRRSALGFYQDLSVTLDYLETRPDIDMRRAGYMGFSFGTFVGSIVLAMEGRLKTAVLISGGLLPQSLHPMADTVNYVPRIKIPVLMVGGRYDHIFDYDKSQRRMFELLGTPNDQKTFLVYEVGHFAFPSNSIAMEISNWYDKYLGPVR